MTEGCPICAVRTQDRDLPPDERALTAFMGGLRAGVLLPRQADPVAKARAIYDRSCEAHQLDLAEIFGALMGPAGAIFHLHMSFMQDGRPVGETECPGCKLPVRFMREPGERFTVAHLKPVCPDFLEYEKLQERVNASHAEPTVE